MIALAPHLGRELAHDTVYDLARESRRDGTPFTTVFDAWLRTRPDLPEISVAADEHAVGHAVEAAEAAISAWRTALADAPSPWKEPR